MQPSQKGWVAIGGRATSGGRLIIDDKFACATPCRAEVAPGKHEVLVEKNGMEDYESDLDVPRGVETTIEVQMSPRPPRTRAITTAIVAAVLIGGGAYVGHLFEQNKDAINNDIAGGVLVDAGDPRFLRGKIEAIGADVLYGIGAIVAVTAVFGLFEHGADSTGVADHKKISFTPTMGPGGGGVSLGGGSDGARDVPVDRPHARRGGCRAGVRARGRRLRLARVRRPQEEGPGRRSRAAGGLSGGRRFRTDPGRGSAAA